MGSPLSLFLFYLAFREKFFDFKNILKLFHCDGGMVDGGGWWMVVDGGRSKKRFSDFAQTLYIDSTLKGFF